MKRAILLIVITVCFAGCWPVSIHKEKAGEFLEEVVRLDDFNSEYDDYNSSLPLNRHGSPALIFSSKRDRKDFFNLVYFSAAFTYDSRLRLEKPVSGSYAGSEYAGSQFLINKANGYFNVLGPNVFFLNGASGEKDNLILFYADDSEGNLEIKHLTYGNDPQPEKFDILNSEKDDAYPSFSAERDKIYFCSNRDGDFDLYEVSITSEAENAFSRDALVHPAAYTIRKMTELSTPYEDKCPNILGNTMVFVSDRPGGKGGFDIYYSKLENGKWSAPVNAGDRINTTYDEYRPLLPDLPNFNYNLMIFSSNRPGGKGGFDLYMTGLDRNKYGRN